MDCGSVDDEILMDKIDKVYKILEKEVVDYKVPVVDLIQIQTKDPFKVLVTTILSARTSDHITVQVAKKLFSIVDGSHDLDRMSVEEIEKLIYPIGFYHSKAKYLKRLPDVVKEQFGGRIPDTVEELVRLPGVGRKTANLVVVVAFGKPAICVDVHVHRIMNRLGYVNTKTTYETEMVLRRKLPIKYWTTINSMLVAFGQNICRPISPKCSICPVKKYCRRNNVTKSR